MNDKNSTSTPDTATRTAPKARLSWEPSAEVQAVFDALEQVSYDDKKGISQIVVRVIELRTEAKRRREMEDVEGSEAGEN